MHGTTDAAAITGVIRFRPVVLGFKKGRQNAKCLAVNVVDGREREKQTSNPPTRPQKRTAHELWN